MKRNKKKLSLLFRQIHFIDKLLIGFMAVLLLQSAYQIFFGGPVSQESTSVDVIVRTSAAAIFGYFISSNFSKTATKRKSVIQKSTDYQEGDIPTSSFEPRAQIGFQTSTEQPADQIGSAASTPTTPSNSSCSPVQIIIVSVIGGLSLFLLLILRNFAEMTSQTAVAASQLRDFVFACIGFLISCREENDDSK